MQLSFLTFITSNEALGVCKTMEKSLYYELYYPPLQMVYGLDGACEVRMVHVEVMVKYHMA